MLQRRKTHQNATGAMMRTRAILEMEAGELEGPEETRKPKGLLARRVNGIWVCLISVDTYVREADFHS